MVHCSCGKPIEKIPEWLAGVRVTFVCTNCPNRQTQKITQISLDATNSRFAPEENLQQLENLEEDDED